MEYKLGFEITGVASLLLAAVVSTVNYYLNAAYLTFTLPIVIGLTAVYPLSTFNVRNDKTAFYGMLLYLAGLLLAPVKLVGVWYIPYLSAVLIVSSSVIMMCSIRGRKSVAPLFCLLPLSLLQNYLLTVVIQLIAALAALVVISPKIVSHRVLLPAGFVVAAFLTVIGFNASGLMLSFASLSVFVLYHSGNYVRCPFRVEPRLASLGLYMIVLTSLVTAILELLGLLGYLNILVGLVLTVSLYIFYTGLIAPRRLEYP